MIALNKSATLRNRSTFFWADVAVESTTVRGDCLGRKAYNQAGNIFAERNSQDSAEQGEVYQKEESEEES